LRAAIDEAAATYASIAAGECEFERTDTLLSCKECPSTTYVDERTHNA